MPFSNPGPITSMVTSNTDGDGYEYRTEYNADEFISAYINPDGSRTQMHYDDAGHISRVINSDETEATLTYDSDGRVVNHYSTIAVARIQV